jgi:hypothetical protein
MIEAEAKEIHSGAQLPKYRYYLGTRPPAYVTVGGGSVNSSCRRMV